MRINELIMVSEKRMPRMASAEMLAHAEACGFDTSKLWFHGTRRRFDGFQLPKESGIDELGSGVYLTSIKWLANTWARERGFIVICVIRKGRLFDFEKINDPNNIAMMRQAFVDYSLAEWVGDKPTNAAESSAEYFDERFKRNALRTAGMCLSYAGYIGGYKHASQIAGQVVIFKPEDVMIVARQGGRSHMTDDQ